MSFKAVLTLGDKNFDLQECRWRLSQRKNRLGIPESVVTGGLIHFIISGSGDDTFASWMGNPKKTESGSITLYRIDQESTFKHLSFENAYLINYVESFVSDNVWKPMRFEEKEFEDDEDLRGAYRLIMETQLRNNISYLKFCRISAEKIKLDGVDHDNVW